LKERYINKKAKRDRLFLTRLLKQQKKAISPSGAVQFARFIKTKCLPLPAAFAAQQRPLPSLYFLRASRGFYLSHHLLSAAAAGKASATLQLKLASLLPMNCTALLP